VAGKVNQISIFVLGSVMVFASAAAPAQDFTAGKTPAQLFSSDCAECHRSPNGLARNRDVRTLASFLREHYTTKSETAGALAAYVAGFAGSGAAAVRNRGSAAASERTERRSRSDSELTATGEDARTNARPVPETPGRRRRATSLSGDDEKRRVRDDGDAPRPPASIVTRAPAKLNAPAQGSAPRDAAEPTSRLRSYLSSGLGYEGTVAEAAKTGAPKGRKRRNRVDSAESPTPGAQIVPTTAADPPTAPPSATIDANAPRTAPEGSASPASSTPPGAEP
jgi:hypothetical protein